MPPSTIHSTNVLYSIIIFTFQRLLTELLDWNQNVIKIVEFRSYPCIRDCTKICSLKSKLASSNAPNMLPLVQNFGASSFSLFHRNFVLQHSNNSLSQYFAWMTKGDVYACRCMAATSEFRHYRLHYEDIASTRRRKINAINPRAWCLLLLLSIVFFVVLLTLELKGWPDTGSLYLVGDTKPIECRIDCGLDGSEDDLPLGGGGGDRRNKGTARAWRRNKGGGRGAVRQGDGGDGCSGNGESNHCLNCSLLLL